MELGLHPGIIFALAIGLFLGLHLMLRWPLPLTFIAVAVAAALLGDFGIPFRHLVEGAFGFINLVLALFAGAFFGQMMRRSGAADKAAAGAFRAARGRGAGLVRMARSEQENRRPSPSPAGGACSIARLLLPSPLWGGAGGGGRAKWHARVNRARPPTPTPPHKGGGRRGRPAICDCLSRESRQFNSLPARIRAACSYPRYLGGSADFRCRGRPGKPVDPGDWRACRAAAAAAQGIPHRHHRRIHRHAIAACGGADERRRSGAGHDAHRRARMVGDRRDVAASAVELSEHSGRHAASRRGVDRNGGKRCAGRAGGVLVYWPGHDPQRSGAVGDCVACRVRAADVDRGGARLLCGRRRNGRPGGPSRLAPDGGAGRAGDADAGVCEGAWWDSHLSVGRGKSGPEFSNMSMMSWSGASKSSEITILPLSVPNLIFLGLLLSTGTIRATGWPLRAMIVVLPRAASFTILDNCALASVILSVFMVCPRLSAK